MKRADDSTGLGAPKPKFSLLLDELCKSSSQCAHSFSRNAYLVFRFTSPAVATVDSIRYPCPDFRVVYEQYCEKV